MSRQSVILSWLFILGLIGLVLGRALQSPEAEAAVTEPNEEGEDLDKAEFFWGGPGPWAPGPWPPGPWPPGPWVPVPWPPGPWPPGPWAPGPWGPGPFGPW